MTAPNFPSGAVWTGDNLNVLRGMNSECVDLIYLDPPFNSNRTYEAPPAGRAARALSAFETGGEGCARGIPDSAWRQP